jgi:hypothetical protein
MKSFVEEYSQTFLLDVLHVGECVGVEYLQMYCTVISNTVYSHIQSIKKSLCTWWIQYRKLQVMFKVSPASLQTFIDTPICVLQDCCQYSTVHIPSVFCADHLQTIFCLGSVQIPWVFFIAPQRKKFRRRKIRRSWRPNSCRNDSVRNTSKSAIHICAVLAVSPSCWK